MIISHQYKFVCLNPPRTGTGYRERVFNQVTDVSISSESFDELNLTDHERRSFRHTNIKEALNIFEKNNWNHEEYYFFTFIREPVDRLISFWAMKDFNKNKKPYERESAIREGYKIDPDQYETLWNTINPSIFEHRQSNYLSCDQRDIDFVGRVENMESDLLFIIKRYDLPIRISEHPIDNKTHKNYSKQHAAAYIRTTHPEIFTLERETYRYYNEKN